MSKSDLVINLLLAIMFYAIGLALFILAVSNVGWFWPTVVVVGVWVSQWEVKITRR